MIEEMIGKNSGLSHSGYCPSGEMEGREVAAGLMDSTLFHACLVVDLPCLIAFRGIGANADECHFSWEEKQKGGIWHITKR